ncbi:MAG: NYN domain-containing protein [Armatimonadetes bacterium]|nr:NYN domain-containing protein [Armatimonadota bacterium]
MAYRVRIFVDFWNFQLSWNEHLGQSRQCDWPKMPLRFVQAAQTSLSKAGITEPLQIEETRVYASYDRGNPAEQKLRGWLTDFLDRQPSFRVFAKQRAGGTISVRCRTCGQAISDCPSCHAPLAGTREKGVDTAIVTDLLSLAWENAYEIAILVTSDADMIPCVERLQEKGFKVINATWAGRGHQLAQVCWASFNTLEVADQFIR